MIVLYAPKVFLFRNHSLTQIFLRFVFLEISSSNNNWQEDVANSSNRRSSSTMLSGRLFANKYLYNLFWKKNFPAKKS